ncbi:hypothetical protein GF371_04185 [Candidatus Woesearchaeota archaeon]|nr:hypothetical protein [Candidatus Woesearchaeota archaeon]
MANKIADDYYHTMDQDYNVKSTEFQKEIGTTVFEGAEGRFHQSVQAKVRSGVGAVELQLGGQGENTGPESYGREAREEIKKLTEMNEVDIHSVHIHPGYIGFAGFDQQRGQFDETSRDNSFNEAVKGIDFAADVTKGGTIVIHTGEFNRPMVSGFKEFEAYEGEEYAADVFFADKESGNVQKLSRDVSIPVIEKELVVDEKGNPVLDEQGNEQWKPVWKEDAPVMKRKSWFTYDDELKKLGEEDFRKKYKIPKDWGGQDLPGAALMFEYFNNQLEGARAQYNRWAEEHGETVRQITALKKRIEKQKAKERELEGKPELQEQYVQHPVSHQMVLKSKLYSENLKRAEGELRYRQELAEDAKRNMEQINKQKENLAPIKEVALKRTADSIGKMGVIAWERTEEKNLARPLTLAPENLGPWQYGSHPEEMVEIVQASRDAMVDRLTKEKIPDPTGGQVFNEKKNEWEPRMVPNPYFKKEFSGKEGQRKAKELAQKHIKATLDFQHLQMWNKHFKRKTGETESEREKRFSKWFTKEVEMLADKGIIGNVHVVDGYGRGHVHLPAGQGRAPVKRAIEILRDKGLNVPMTSEGWFEGPARQITEPWELEGKQMYTPMGTYNFARDVMSRQYGMYAPTYLFGEMAPHPEDFTVWSEVPLE